MFSVLPIERKKMFSVLEMFEKALNSIYDYPLLFILPSIFFILFLYKWLSINSSNLQKLPPSPPKMPILGHLHKLGMHPHRSLRSLSEHYGELMLIYLGRKPTLIVSSAKVAKEILKSHDAVFSNRPKSRINDKLLYSSKDIAASPYGEYWRQIKGIFVLQLLSNRRVRSYKCIRDEEAALLMQKIQQNDGSVVNLSDMFVVFTNDVVCRVAFGRKYGGNQQSDIDFKEVLKQFAELLGVFDVGAFIPWLAWVNRFNGLNKRLEKVAKDFDLLLEDILKEHLDRLNPTGSYHESENEARDFVDVLLEVQKENSAGFTLERDSIKALILDAFAAGTDTTHTMLEWAMTELLRNPRVMEELQTEVRGIGNKEKITEDDLEKMKYLEAVIKEALRLHPPIPILVPRESTQDVKINGYDIAARTLIYVNVWAIQRDPMTWQEPEEFRPERFLSSSIDYKGQDFELIPFGSGRRICPGISFSIANIKLVLAKLVHKFDWKLPAGVKGDTMDMSESSGLAVHRKTPLLAIPTPHLYQ